MTFDGLVLYGPPASGKDAVTAELCKLSDAYAYFEKLKVGEGRTAGYRPATHDQLTGLRARGLIIHEVTRYDATYAVDSVHLDELFNGGHVPIIHMGQVSGVDALRTYGRRWLDVLLWCPKDVAADRLRMRGSVDIHARLTAWDETLADLQRHGETRFTMSVRTDGVSPATAAVLIKVAMRGRC